MFTGVRNLTILKCNPGLCVSGDLFGELKVWDLEEKSLKYEVEDVNERSLFRTSGAIVALSEFWNGETGGGVLAAVNGNLKISIYFTGKVLACRLNSNWARN